MLRSADFGAACVGGGLLVGAREHNRVNTLVARVEAIASAAVVSAAVDRTDAEALMSKAVEVAANTPESCAVLATNRANAAPATRVVLLKEPFGVTRDGNDVSVYFNTTQESRKVAELHADPHATLTYWDPTSLSYATFTGKAQELPPNEAKGLFTPFLRLFYPEGPDAASGSSYTAWRLRASNVQLVAIPGVESTRPDWRPVELVQSKPNDRWFVACDGVR